MRDDPPQLRLLGDELVHQLLAARVADDDDLDAARAQVGLAAEEVCVLADDDAGDAVEEAGPRAHVAGREGRVHCAALVGPRGQAARVEEG